MAGAGLDARMIRDADGGPKDQYGRLAYVWAASKNLRRRAIQDAHRGQRGPLVQGRRELPAVGNVGALFGGVEAFDSASPEDGLLEVGVTHAESLGQWARTVARPRSARCSIPVRASDEGRAIDVEFDRKVLYELDGGSRKQVKRLKVKVKPGALTVMAPAEAHEHGFARQGNLGADGRRRPQDTPVDRTDGASQGCDRPPPRRRRHEPLAASPSRYRSCSSKASSSWSASQWRPAPRDFVSCSSTRSRLCPGPTSDLLTQRGSAGDACRPPTPLSPADPRPRRHRHHGHNRDGAARASHEPDLRSREGPSVRREVQACVRARAERRRRDRRGVRAARLRPRPRRPRRRCARSGWPPAGPSE